ncbi:gamma-glutamyltransferase [Roseovarius sp. 22II1-1F6A]|nr:gamma-glutamyltransferase [Roseovarius sp. 22II1-1F6A]
MRDFQKPGRSAVYARNGMCATSHPLAAAVAVDLLKQGGSAVDAALGAAAILSLCEPPMTGFGGDCFALVKPAGTEDIIGLNASGRGPAGLDAAAIRAEGHSVMPVTSAHAVTLPGAVSGFLALSERFGRMDLAEVFAPAIRYADEGVPVAPRVALDMGLSTDRLQGFARRDYLKDGRALRAGELFRAPGQGEVLRRIVRDGHAGFYQGEVAEDMVNALRAAGGSHTLEDFAGVQPEWTTPISGGYRGLEIVEHQPNGQGTAALLLAAILERFDLASMDPWGPERTHIEAEATKLAYDARDRFVTDPDHMDPVTRLQADGLADKLAALIAPDRVMPDAARISEEVHRDTVYLTVVDKDRMAVSLIYSIFNSFGSGIGTEKFGLLMHNRGAGFSITEGHPNEAAPGKRPMHTILPGMIRQEGRLLMPFGVMGGQYQAAGHARFASNIADYGLDPQSALDAPRAFATEGVLELETGYPEATRAALLKLGHKVTVPDRPIGGAQAIRLNDGGDVLEGASDPRKDGMALGY